MTIQQAIEKAIEGGYAKQQSYYTKHISFTSLKNTNEFFTTFETNEKIVIEDGEGGRKEIYITTTHQTNQIFLDPLFWQSLGKAMGWEETSHLESPYCWYYKGIYRRNLWGAEWEYNQHRFIDHLAEGKDAESFFEKL